jgi:hypothetical protein
MPSKRIEESRIHLCDALFGAIVLFYSKNLFSVILRTAIGSDKTLQWLLHDRFALFEFVKRVLCQPCLCRCTESSHGDKPKPTQDVLSAIALRGEPLYPASLDGSDEFVARITPLAIECVTLVRS